MVSGRPKVQKAMSLWYEQYRLPPNAEKRYQYSIFDAHPNRTHNRKHGRGYELIQGHAAT